MLRMKLILNYFEQGTRTLKNDNNITYLNSVAQSTRCDFHFKPLNQLIKSVDGSLLSCVQIKLVKCGKHL